mmetsp:Transcript_57434/g.163090  ORF Transcript_57434/g.163090 Transcript_57434/m.163090 type:complete len:129 (+) Transcript_57434:376-762(+)
MQCGTPGDGDTTRAPAGGGAGLHMAPCAGTMLGVEMRPARGAVCRKLAGSVLRLEKGAATFSAACLGLVGVLASRTVPLDNRLSGDRSVAGPLADVSVWSGGSLEAVRHLPVCKTGVSGAFCCGSAFD